MRLFVGSHNIIFISNASKSCILLVTSRSHNSRTNRVLDLQGFAVSLGRYPKYRDSVVRFMHAAIQ